jgi:hypothetical protein
MLMQQCSAMKKRAEPILTYGSGRTVSTLRELQHLGALLDKHVCAMLMQQCSCGIAESRPVSGTALDHFL